MRTVKVSALFLMCAFVVLTNGCAPELDNLRIQNETQQRRIAELESDLQSTRLKFAQVQRGLDTADSRCDIALDALQEKLDALKEDSDKKKALIATMRQQLLYGGAELPVELSTMLEDFAKGQEMVTYDSSRGIVKFKSDLLFERGSDKVASAAVKSIGELCTILNSEQGKKFDIIIAGHTDDLRISRPATRERHPTNWHLSAHRAISVLDIMTNNKITSERMSIRGFGEFRPIVPNKPNKKGEPQNRRVEIYIVPQGM
ncbi:MAG: OmpA family protein [Planctomycetota bacterium]|nr:MAG: OmpA family protein [Planctomycetota bacterium]